MTGQRRYHCTRSGCSFRDKWIPGRDADLPRTIRTGCDWCETVTTFKKVGVR